MNIQVNCVVLNIVYELLVSFVLQTILLFCSLCIVEESVTAHPSPLQTLLLLGVSLININEFGFNYNQIYNRRLLISYVFNMQKSASSQPVYWDVE